VASTSHGVRQPLHRRLAINRPLDLEEDIDRTHSLAGNRRLSGFRQIEELSAAVAPAGRFKALCPVNVVGRGRDSCALDLGLEGAMAGAGEWLLRGRWGRACVAIGTEVESRIKDQVHQIEFPDGKKIILLSEGRLANLGNATGHPGFVMSASFTNQVLAQIELHTNGANYSNEVYVLPKHLDEKVARLHLEKLGAKLTVLTDEQAKYIDVSSSGPYKPERYRY
jgi:hypothetical protein